MEMDGGVRGTADEGSNAKESGPKSIRDQSSRIGHEASTGGCTALC